MARKVYFEYRDKGEAGYCAFIATHDDGRKWQASVPMPYPWLHDFWDNDPYAGWVTKVSHRIASEENAPLWVFE